MYDGSTACWEAIVMARRITRRGKAVLSGGLHPHYVSVANTMAKFTANVLDETLPELSPATDVARLLAARDADTRARVAPYPNIPRAIPDLPPTAQNDHAKGTRAFDVLTDRVAGGAHH